MAFRHTGKSSVFLSGYMTRSYGMYGDEDEYETGSDSESESSESESESEDEEAPAAVPLLQNGKKVSRHKQGGGVGGASVCARTCGDVRAQVCWVSAQRGGGVCWHVDHGRLSMCACQHTPPPLCAQQAQHTWAAPCPCSPHAHQAAGMLTAVVHRLYACCAGA